MGVASSIAERIRGHNCERLVRYTAQEVAFTGVGGEAAGYKINIGAFSNNFKTTNTVTEMMKALDNNQYLLCKQAHDSSASSAFKDKCLQARVMCTIGLSNFQALAALQEPSKPLNPEIRKWIKNMNALVLRCMESFLPEPRLKSIQGTQRLRKLSRTAHTSKPNTTMDRLNELKGIDGESFPQDYCVKRTSDKRKEEKITQMGTIRSHRRPATAKELTLSQIMKYQGIDKEDMNKAVEILKQ